MQQELHCVIGAEFGEESTLIRPLLWMKNSSLDEAQAGLADRHIQYSTGVSFLPVLCNHSRGEKHETDVLRTRSSDWHRTVDAVSISG